MKNNNCALLVRKIRLLMNLTQKQFAEHIGVSPYAICAYEQSKRWPNSNTLRSILKAASDAGLELTALDFDIPSSNQR